jgi:ankyrin repeat protein
VAKLLLQRTDIDVNMVEGQGNTSLMLASCSGHLNVVESLLQRKDVDVNRGVDDGKGRTAQMQAARYGLVFDSTSRIVDKSTIFFRLSRSRLIFG